MAISYKDAGVDLESYEEAMARLPALMKRTQTPRVLPLVGGFAGLFGLNGDGKKYRDPVLVSGTDGVGTKIKVAMLAGRYDTIGIDLVGMCVNDCLCLGAEPLFFLDYVALGQDNPDLTTALVKGVSDGCVDAKAALIGGETAIMPDLYAPGDFDMAGFCVGVVERDKILDGKAIRAGDVLVGIESSGFHSNGYSLVRKAVFGAAGLKVTDHVPELNATVGEVLLTPTRIYAQVVQQLLNDERTAPGVTGLAHITGGGLADNTGRVIPAGLQAAIFRSRWTPPAMFSWLQGLGDIAREEMYQVFNMGIGMVVCTRPEHVSAVQAIVSDCGMKSHLVGEVRPGTEPAVYVD
ncbi:phosphoribosylformylglycinamidine cyclo-ligase [Planctomicrobium piriforme]|uniref:Phosphoribosylformylglycinamidine cyclo-ligase n=1 Tax=Planctomicrobium piriforme TaxID=1576369 RepID=A0A1I3C8U4_9PLAN|nr:phosphoribosylformylglycinamidine cyclo-ligase [Planctomicrobium piriforme]SFH70833.1 phosphoribosylformylglycinamidine cyclo-ligase [Planctomicrobium piriforme]